MDGWFDGQTDGRLDLKVVKTGLVAVGIDLPQLNPIS